MAGNLLQPRLALFRWVAAFALGIPIGLLLALAPMLGLIIGGIAAVWAIAAKPRLSPLSGLLIGTSATYLMLLFRASAECRTIKAQDYFYECRPPDELAVYQFGAATVLTIGLLLMLAQMVLAARDRRANRAKED